MVKISLGKLVSVNIDGCVCCSVGRVELSLARASNISLNDEWLMYGDKLNKCIWVTESCRHRDLLVNSNSNSQFPCIITNSKTTIYTIKNNNNPNHPCPYIKPLVLPRDYHNDLFKISPTHLNNTRSRATLLLQTQIIIIDLFHSVGLDWIIRLYWISAIIILIMYPSCIILPLFK